MTLNNCSAAAFATLLALGLTGCGDGSSEEGIRVSSQTTYMTADTPNGDPDAATDPALEPSTIKPIYRDDNMFIEMQLGLVNLRVVELLPCSSLAAKAASGLLNFIFPAAQAHAAHIPSGPTGVIDVLKPDLLVWDLGEQVASSGDYCGLKLEIAPVVAHHTAASTEGEAEASEEGIDMAGKAVLVSPCYYPDTASTPRTPLDGETSHSCIEAAYTGEAISAVINFSETLKLNNERRSANLMLATHYDQWFNDLDMTILADDQDEQKKLAENILASFYVYALAN